MTALIPGSRAAQVGGRILASGAAATSESVLSDHFHGQDADWDKAALNGGIGLIAGALGEVPGGIRNRQSSGLYLGSGPPQINTTLYAARHLKSYPGIRRVATSRVQEEMAGLVTRDIIRGIGYGVGSAVVSKYAE